MVIVTPQTAQTSTGPIQVDQTQGPRRPSHTQPAPRKQEMPYMASSVAVRWFALSILALLALVACGKNEDASTAGPPQAANEAKQLNIYSWADYVAPDTISNFENET